MAAIFTNWCWWKVDCVWSGVTGEGRRLGDSRKSGPCGSHKRQLESRPIQRAKKRTHFRKRMEPQCNLYRILRRKDLAKDYTGG